MRTTAKIKLKIQKILPKSVFESILYFYRNLKHKLNLDEENLYKLKNFKNPEIIDLNYDNIKFKLKIDPTNVGVDTHIYLNNKYEPYIVKKIIENIKKGETVLDIGANIGHHSIIMSKCVEKNGKVISFEPIPRIIKQFKESIEINDIKNIEVKEFGLSNKEENIKFYIDKNNAGHSSAIQDNKINTEEINIHTKTLDSLNLNTFSFVKIDVEGYEWNVIEGGMNTFLKYRPIILMEWSPIFYRLNDETHSIKILNFFLENNYKIIDLDNKNKEITKENIETFMKDFAPTLIGQTNLLCTPK